jgi:hypothetical protein
MYVYSVEPGLPPIRRCQLLTEKWDGNNVYVTISANIRQTREIVRSAIPAQLPNSYRFL